MSKKLRGTGGLVYSTDPGAIYTEPEVEIQTLEPAKQRLRISLDTKQRAGKAVTLITGFLGRNEDLEALGKLLKTRCGTGGSVKDGQIIVQGDYRERLGGLLRELGYSVKG